MAVPSHKDMHMEALEEDKDENTKPAYVGSPRGNGLQGRKLSERLLVDEQHGSGQNGFDKRKTDTPRLLRFSLGVSVCARQLLKPPCTERYARWCERTAANHRLLLDLLLLFTAEIPYGGRASLTARTSRRA